MFRRILLVVLVVGLTSNMAWAAVYNGVDPPEYLRKWGERAAKSASLRLGPTTGARQTAARLAKDLDRQLALIKIEEAEVDVAVADDQVTIEISLRYDQPDRTITRRVVEDGVVIGYTERIDYGWRVHVVARKGKLLTSKGEYIREFNSYGHAP